MSLKFEINIIEVKLSVMISELQKKWCSENQNQFCHFCLYLKASLLGAMLPISNTSLTEREKAQMVVGELENAKGIINMHSVISTLSMSFSVSHTLH